MELINKIQSDIASLDGRITKQQRDIAKRYKKELDAMDITDIYHLCDILLETRNRAETIIAYQIIFDQKKKYNKETFFIFEKWLFAYVKDWWDCDDFMTHAFQVALMMYKENIARVKNWTSHEEFAVRRSAAVILIRPAQKGLLEESIIFEICDSLLTDPHDLVQKGVGWLLKESYKCYPKSVINYLEKNYSKMTRTVFRYALEKMPKEEKQRLMQYSK